MTRWVTTDNNTPSRGRRRPAASEEATVGRRPGTHTVRPSTRTLVVGVWPPDASHHPATSTTTTATAVSWTQRERRGPSLSGQKARSTAGGAASEVRSGVLTCRRRGALPPGERDG